MAKVSLRAYNREIEAMIDRGQLDEAIAHCHHILKTFPKHLETYRLLGKAYLEAKRHGDAADIFLRILASIPNDFVAQVGMSIIRDEENKLDDAIWHMERAFETQPSNPAIQSELQRLYGRRDGVQPPRIRMTRGALAHMYVQGELYPQAISEIRSVLKDDPGRADMQALLARACYKSGAKNEAAEVASTLLKRYPYSLDANRVLAEILGAERPENAQLYRQRVVELDPYAAQVAGTMFRSNEVHEAAVAVERLDWNGQPVSMQSDWGETRAISLESGTERDEQPDWLKSSLGETQPSARFDETPHVPAQQTPASMFETPAPAQPADEIPDFLRAAGWGESTGAFDESKSSFTQEAPTGSAEPLAQGDLPDWVKAMKPPEPESAVESREEELPDWINNIDKGVLSSQTSESMDWQSQPTPEDRPSTTEDQPDWMKGLSATEEPAPASQEQPDWLQSFGSESDITPQPAETETPDWLKGLGTEPEPAAEQPSETDWLKDFGSEPQPAATEPAEEVDWFKQSDAETPAPEPSTADFDFLNELTEEPVLQTPESTRSTGTDQLGGSEQERDDSFAWLESLAAKQGATEGLLTKPEERRDEEPDWVKQAKGLGTEKPSETVEPSIPQPAANVEELGKTEQEQDDSFAWLENLAAKQGATEGLLTKPEERREEEPEWVKQAKGLSSQPSQVTPSSANLEELGKSEQEQDDSFAWLENLAAKQGATEGLLTKPEERREEEPEWVKQAKDLSAQQPPTPVTPETQPASMDETGMWLRGLEQPEKPSEPEPAADDTATWLKSLEEEKVSEPEPAADETAMWLKSIEEEKISEFQPASDETATWLRNLEEEKTEQPKPGGDETAVWLRDLEEEKLSEPEPAADETLMWLKNLDETESGSEVAPSIESGMPEWLESVEETPVAESNIPVQEPSAMEESKLEEESLPSWLAELDQEEEKPVSTSADEDLPAWLRAEEAAPAKAEPTRASDWKHVEEQQPGIIYSPPLEEPNPSKIIYSPPLEETKEPEPEIAAPPVAETAFEEPVVFAEEKAAAPEPQSFQQAPAEAAPVAETRRGTGMLSIPTIDPMLGSARNEMSRSNVSGALESYARLIKKGRFLDEVIYDLRDALYRYPVEVSIWQSLGDAYMRANRLQDALDAYTKAEELLR